MTQVSLGEQMAAQGESIYGRAVMKKLTVCRSRLQPPLRPRLLQGVEGLPVTRRAHYAL